MRRGGKRSTYCPETLEIVEVNIVLGDLLEDTEIILSLVQGANGGVAARLNLLLALPWFVIFDKKGSC